MAMSVFLYYIDTKVKEKHVSKCGYCPTNSNAAHFSGSLEYCFSIVFWGCMECIIIARVF